jgi:hypothetical protein
MASWAMAAQVPGPPGEDSEAAIQLIRAQMVENLRRQPNYTCLETLDRSTKYARGPDTWDRARLEVALVDGKEVFAWPGSDRFEHTDPSDLIPGGTTSNGSFALHAANIFRSGIARFRRTGEETVGNRTLSQYEYRVPREESGRNNWNLMSENRHATVGAHGTFLVDPVNRDVLRLEVIADDIPSEIGMTSVVDRVDYERVHIGDEQFLLPVAGELAIVAPGRENRNVTRFTDCRQFGAQSTIVFDEEVAESPSAKNSRGGARQELHLPGDLLLKLALLEEIDWEQAAAGDRLRAELREAVRRGERVLAPKGAVASGRILKLGGRGDRKLLGFEFRELEWRGGRAQLESGRVLGARQRGVETEWSSTIAGEVLVIPKKERVQGLEITVRTLDRRR